MKAKIIAILLMTLLIATATSVAAPFETQVTKEPVNFADGLTFSQVDFFLGEENQKDSEWGHVEVDIREITKEIQEGFLNVYTNAGWVVRNEFINQVENMNYLSMYFNLGVKPGEPIRMLSAYVDFSKEPYVEFKDGQRNEYEVKDKIYSVVGVGDYWEIMALGELLPFEPQAITYDYTKPNLNENENVQAAWCQCFPMAIANSLQYLENRNPSFVVPHDHVIGLKGDDSLVGQLDEYCDRYAPSRTVGSGVWFDPMMKGKFQYLADNGLADKLEHKHQGYGYGQPIPPGDYTHAGITSKDESVDGKVTFDWIEEQLRMCEDVEIVKNGHAVRVFGCGKTLGKPYLRYKHDSIQTSGSDPNDTLGLEEVQIYVEDTDGDGMMNWGSSSSEIWWALAESVKKSKSEDVFGVENGLTRGRAEISTLLQWFLEQFPILQQLLGL